MKDKNKINENSTDRSTGGDHPDSKHTERLLREKLEDLEAIFKAIPDLFFRLDSSGAIIDYYAGAEMDLYVPPEQFMGKCMRDVLPADVGKEYDKALHEVQSTKSPSIITYSLEIDGFEKHFEGRVLPCGEQAVILVRNITERRKMEVRIEESERKYRLFTDNLGDLVYSAEPITFKATFVNKAVEEFYGYTPEEWLDDATLWENTIHPDDKDRVIEEINKNLHEQREYRVEYRIIRRDGSIRFAIDSAWPRKDKNGNIVSLDGIMQDITERKQVEEQLREAKERAEAANIAKSQFLAKMSHEIRTPLSVIIAASDLLGMEGLPDDQKSHTELLQNAGKALLQIVDDLLDISSIERGTLKLRMIDLPLEKLLNELQSILLTSAKEKGLQFSIVCSDCLPSSLHTDSNRLEQCLTNLISNAIKFTEKGHVNLRVSADSIDGAPFIRFDVEDTGIGISSDRLESIFDPFEQVDAGGACTSQGTGLGLTITRELARMLGGSISVASEPGKGSVFSLLIPVSSDAVGKAEALVESTFEPEIIDAAQFSGRALLVDDYQGIRSLFGRMLERHGLEVTVAENGQQAIELISEQSFDLIFMDMQMPILDGYAATRRLRDDGVTTPVVALTAYAMAGDDNKCREAGCDDYLAKPIDGKKLKMILSKHLPPQGDRP